MASILQCRRLFAIPIAAASLMALIAMTGFSLPAFAAPQASVTLQNSDAKYCYVHDNKWDLTKEVTSNTIDAASGSGTVTWTVTATKDSSGAPIFCVRGGLTVLNSGSAPATIGNIVVNLQKPNSPKNGSNAPYVSIAADMADATHGDAATSAHISAGGSQENVATNAAWGTNNYTVSGTQGTFVKTAGSGPLEFTDASNNTVFSLVPQPVIPASQSITLLYAATFQTSVLPPAGTTLRVEAMVTFGNAGPRSGDTTVAANVDINGNGSIDTDEGYVRTVPSRITMAALPAAPEETNASVTVTDPGVSTTGTVTTSNPLGFDAFPATVSATTSWTVSVNVDSGTDGGQVCNAAELNGTANGGTLNVIVGYDNTDPLNPIPIYATYECAAAAHDSASACVTVGPAQQVLSFCTYTQGGYQGGGVPRTIFNNYFISVFQSQNTSVAGTSGTGGLMIGTFGNNGSTLPNGAFWQANASGQTALPTYLAGGGGSGVLGNDTLNPTSTAGGALAKQTATLTLNVGFSGTVTSPITMPSGFGSLVYHNTGDALDTNTVSQILAAANAALNNGTLPTGYTFGSLNNLITNLNESFDNCSTTGGTAWALTHLSAQ